MQFLLRIFRKLPFFFLLLYSFCQVKKNELHRGNVLPSPLCPFLDPFCTSLVRSIQFAIDWNTGNDFSQIQLCTHNLHRLINVSARAPIQPLCVCTVVLLSKASSAPSPCSPHPHWVNQRWRLSQTFHCNLSENTHAANIHTCRVVLFFTGCDSNT